MGYNLHSVCHGCKEKITHRRGDEAVTLGAFYQKHTGCLHRGVQVETVSDHMRDKPDWVEDTIRYKDLTDDWWAEYFPESDNREVTNGDCISLAVQHNADPQKTIAGKWIAVDEPTKSVFKVNKCGKEVIKLEFSLGLSKADIMAMLEQAFPLDVDGADVLFKPIVTVEIQEFERLKELNKKMFADVGLPHEKE